MHNRVGTHLDFRHIGQANVLGDAAEIDLPHGDAVLFVDLLDVGPRTLGEVVGEPLDVVRATPRVDHASGARLLLEEELCVSRDAGAEVGREGECLVERVGVQRLRVAVGGSERFEARTDDVVVDVLGRQAPAAGLAVRPQREAGA